MIVVQLTEREIAMAKAVARRRTADNAAAGRVPAHRLPVDRAPQVDEQGCVGEAAAAKGLNLFWGEWERFRAVDVGGRVEVRTVDKPGRALILHKNDRDDLPFLLVDLSDLPTARLLGWTFGGDGKRLGMAHRRSLAVLFRRQSCCATPSVRRLCRNARSREFDMPKSPERETELLACVMAGVRMREHQRRFSNAKVRRTAAGDGRLGRAEKGFSTGWRRRLYRGKLNLRFEQ